jgi:SAM-dependent methyltransferase
LCSGPHGVVASGYDRIADRYADWQAGVEGDPRARYVSRLLSGLPPGPRILEIGCGAGAEPTPTLAARGDLTAVDISAAQLERARAAVPEARFLHGDVTKVDFRADAFDAVVALYVLNHIRGRDLPRLIGRIGRWLAPGGLVLATFAAGAGDSLVDDWLGVPMFFGGLDPASNTRIVEGAGLTVLQSRPEPMLEPESEPGRGRERVVFQWMLAAKPGDRSHLAPSPRSAL